MWVAAVVLCALLLALPSRCERAEDTDLRVVVRNAYGAHRYELRCDPPSGTVPDPAAACATLEANENAMLFPPDLNRICAGGEFTPFIDVVGRFEGKPVSATVSTCAGNVRGEQLWFDHLPPPPRG